MRKILYVIIDIGSIDNVNHKLSDTNTIIEASDAPSRARKIVKDNDIIYSTVRPYLHNTCIIDRSFPFMAIASTGFAVLSCYTGIDYNYLFYLLLSPFFDKYVNSSENSKGVAYPAISETKLKQALIPVPPTQEQRRIAMRIQYLKNNIKSLS